MVKFVTNTFLLILEYLFKVSSGIAGLIVLGAPGTFFAKLTTGFGGLLPTIRQIVELPQTLTTTTAVITDYNTLTAASFNQRYGAQAVNNVMESMNESLTYFQAVYQNLSIQPASTALAFLIAFLTFYTLGRAICFIRQKGQGSFMTRMERKWGERIFEK